MDSQTDMQETKESPAVAGAEGSTARDQVFEARRELINRIDDASLRAVLDGLQYGSPGRPTIIEMWERKEVLQKHCMTRDQVRCLVDMLWKKGQLACKRFLSLLEEEDSALSEDLFGEQGQTNDVPEEDCYPMTARPRGLCLIINNYKFDPPLSNRGGTEQDTVSLRSVFQKLHFTVEEENDLTSNKIVDVVDRYARKDHSAYDAVVVCVLSHGLEGSVMGVDGHPVKIQDISKPFTLNRSLAGKPKIFFIQACQGTGYQQGYSDEEDGPQEQQDEYLEDDAYNSPVSKPSLAIEADILIGMSTVETYKSFRHPRTGSIYIQALCRALESRCPKKEDVLTILTHVNREVCDGNFLTYKQMPQPKFTLRKKLVFTID